jgi:PfaD family protein
MLERDLFRAPLETIWAQTAEFFKVRDPKQLDRAAQDPKHRMALTFRWYLGQASRWANAGEASRKLDFQVWCGPAMGAFNEWAKGSFLDDAQQRRVAVVARNLMAGAAVLTEAYFRRLRGETISSVFAPLTDEQLTPYFDEE